jgi:hypothetical protein
MEYARTTVALVYRYKFSGRYLTKVEIISRKISVVFILFTLIIFMSSKWIIFNFRYCCSNTPTLSFNNHHFIIDGYFLAFYCERQFIIINKPLIENAFRNDLLITLILIMWIITPKNTFHSSSCSSMRQSTSASDRDKRYVLININYFVKGWMLKVCEAVWVMAITDER